MISLRLTAPMMKALRLAEQGGLRRSPGGFWTSPGLLGPRVPKDWTGIVVIRALESRGLLERSRALEESWRDDRVLTEEGRSVLASIAKARED